MTEEMMQSLEDRGLVIRLGPGRPPSFYVTESRDLPVERFDQRGYVLTVQG
jgi:sugar-specific transcriptional regulator TrmB